MQPAPVSAQKLPTFLCKKEKKWGAYSLICLLYQISNHNISFMFAVDQVDIWIF